MNARDLRTRTSPDLLLAASSGNGSGPRVRSGYWGKFVGRKFLMAAAIVLATAVGLTGKVIARTGEGIQPAPEPSASSAAIPAFLRPVAMDATAASSDLALIVDLPVNGTIYPPDIIPPQFAWRDNNSASTVWRIEIAFGEHGRPIKVWSNGEKMQLAPVDSDLTSFLLNLPGAITIPPALCGASRSLLASMGVPSRSGRTAKRCSLRQLIPI